MDPTKLIPDLPEWFAIPVVIIIVLVHVWGTLLPVVSNLSFHSKKVKEKKEELDLLKLQFDINEIKEKSNVPLTVSAECESYLSESISVRNQKKTEIKGWMRFLSGFIGSLVPAVFELIFLKETTYRRIGLSQVDDISIRLLSYSLIIGLITLFLTRPDSSKQVCLVIGFLMAILGSIVVR